MKSFKIFEPFRASIEVVNINELSLFQDKVSAVVSTSISTSITQAATITDKLELRRYEISKLEPEWTVVPIQFVDMMTYEKPESLHMIIRDRRLKTKTRMEQVKMGAEPFAEGADRIVFHGILLAPLGVQAAAAANNKRWRTSALGTHIVLKQFKQIVPNMDAEAFFYEEQAQLQAIAAYFAHEFSRVKDLHPPIQLRYIQSKICKTAHGILYSVEAELQEGRHCLNLVRKVYLICDSLSF